MVDDGTKELDRGFEGLEAEARRRCAVQWSISSTLVTAGAEIDVSRTSIRVEPDRAASCDLRHPPGKSGFSSGWLVAVSCLPRQSMLVPAPPKVRRQAGHSTNCFPWVSGPGTRSVCGAAAEPWRADRTVRDSTDADSTAELAIQLTGLKTPTVDDFYL
jgi:hypothetical protein